MFVGMTPQDQPHHPIHEHRQTAEVNADWALVGSIAAPLFLVGILVIAAIGGGLPAVVAAFVALLIATALVTSSIRRSLSQN